MPEALRQGLQAPAGVVGAVGWRVVVTARHAGVVAWVFYGIRRPFSGFLPGTFTVSYGFFNILVA